VLGVAHAFRLGDPPTAVHVPMRGRKNPPLDRSVETPGAPLTFDAMSMAYLQDYQLQRYRSLTTARARVEHLRSVFGGWTHERITADASHPEHRLLMGNEFDLDAGHLE
jgi:hypothetical protein